MLINEIEEIIMQLPLTKLKRIDSALEGNWSQTVTTIWTREDGFIGFSKVTKSHSTLRPSLELYFEGWWVGVPCCQLRENMNLFDERLALEIIRRIEAKGIG